MQIIVRDNNVDQALRALKKKLQREGVYREMKLRRHYEKPSEKRARERAARAARRHIDSRELQRRSPPLDCDDEAAGIGQLQTPRDARLAHVDRQRANQYVADVPPGR